MRTINRMLLLGLTLCLALTTGFAQEASGTLDGQFNELIESSNSVKSSSGREYKVVNLQDLNNIWKNVQDHMAASKAELEGTQNKVESLNQEVAKLTQKIDEQQSIVEASEHATTHISVLGLDIPKDKFVGAFWITTAILLVLLAGAIYQFKRSRRITQRTQMNFMQLQEEMEELRRNSLEKERRLRRELQTERNAVEEMGRNTGIKR
jgi:cell division protein FtsB